MSYKIKGQLVTFTCDACDQEFSCAGSFMDVWGEAKDNGWRAKKSGDEWEHRCPDCVFVVSRNHHKA